MNFGGPQWLRWVYPATLPAPITPRPTVSELLGKQTEAPVEWQCRVSANGSGTADLLRAGKAPCRLGQCACRPRALRGVVGRVGLAGEIPEMAVWKPCREPAYSLPSGFAFENDGTIRRVVR